MDNMHHSNSKEANQMAKALAASQAITHLVEMMTTDPAYGPELDAYEFFARQLRSIDPDIRDTTWNLVAKMDQVDRDLPDLPTYTTTRPMILAYVDAKIRTLALAAAMARTGANVIDELFAGLT